MQLCFFYKDKLKGGGGFQIKASNQCWIRMITKGNNGFFNIIYILFFFKEVFIKQCHGENADPRGSLLAGGRRQHCWVLMTSVTKLMERRTYCFFFKTSRPTGNKKNDNHIMNGARKNFFLRCRHWSGKGRRRSIYIYIKIYIYIYINGKVNWFSSLPFGYSSSFSIEKKE